MVNPRKRGDSYELCANCGYYIYEPQEIQYSGPQGDLRTYVKAFHVKHADCTRSQLMGQPMSPFGPARYTEVPGLQDQ